MSRCALLAVLLLIACDRQSGRSTIDNGGGIEPDEALETIEIADGFKVELIASEPLIADPVAMEVDESGNLYVLEMHGYPLNTTGTGVIKRLVDTDNDGLPDQSTVYADGLVLPTGIMRWKNGFIVTDSPDVLYLEDSDGDGRADIREAIITGFARSNPQHNANSPMLGIDNWIYIAHEREVTPNVYVDQFGDVGSDVRFTNGNAPSLPRNAGGKSIRFKPDSKQIEMLSGESQFGQTFDPWGHLLGTSNAQHLFHEVIAARYLHQKDSRAIVEATQLISDHGDAAEVFPVTMRPEHQLLTDVGVITSSCGVTWYTGGMFPEPYSSVTFIAEPVHNLVHADRISGSGATFTAKRLLTNREFFASTDSWCRPVNFYIGPDGALYIIDYYRRFIEHPEWMDEETAGSDALYDGMNMGRIYRVTPEESESMSWLGKIGLGNASPAELVKTLSHPNLWWRRHAQRLLHHHHNDDSIADLLGAYLLDSPPPEGLIHALWILHEKKLIKESDVINALSHKSAAVRENAIKIGENYLNEWASVTDRLVTMASDPDPKVRFQLLCTAGISKTTSLREMQMRIAFADIEDPWVQVATLSASAGNELDLIRQAILHLTPARTNGRLLFLSKCSSALGSSGRVDDVNAAINLALSGSDSHDAWWAAGILKGLGNVDQAVANRAIGAEERSKLLGLFSPTSNPDLRAAAIRLLALATTERDNQYAATMTFALKVARDNQADAKFRADALRLIATGSSTSEMPWMQQLIHPSQPEIVQEAAILAMMTISTGETTAFLVENWATLSPQLRNVAVRNILGSDESASVLLDGISNQTVGAETLEWPFKVGLMNHDRKEIRSRARELLTAAETNREGVIKKYEPALTRPGAAEKGRVIFEKNCSPCHQVNNSLGTHFGPDLVSIRNRERQFILNDILLPNRSIADGYDLWNVETKDGGHYAGVLIGQNAQALILRTALGDEIQIDRDDIKQAQSNQTSAMPEGLEQSISVEDMTDLLAFLKGE